VIDVTETRSVSALATRTTSITSITHASPLRTQGRIPQELHADFDDELDAHMAENAKLRAGAATE